MNVSKKYKSKIMCKACQQETWHNVINEYEKFGTSDDGDIWDSTTFLTLRCLGCDNICLLIRYVSSEDVDPQTGDPDITESVHPTPFRSDRELVNGYFSIPKDVRTIYEETIKSFNAGMLILTAIGVRTTIEAISIQQDIKVQGINTKIDEMVHKNIITRDGAVLLMLVKDIGNLATHEIKKHHKDDLSLCIDVIEDIIRNLYIHPQKAKLTRELIEGGWSRA
ncbi:hypothetical protein A2380_03650 [candidate division WWE3 bacterium RIFOXYB1_FULL_43_24]|uniref:DUF4145 domain-containing protein n=2 Tax=Katanobacteria TaxID=422282 RepID=A0A0G0YQ92_UNCKA|nr:MAG: hypothetical protein UU92_C0006G0045 [candidate division WWE3 bacterium GW2011_GWA1_42_12]KKS34396.1 MAG: hypothetical protein UU97_C0011G0032 [candidate division WWE3 bacterium GW2011_GWD1_42_14]KKS38830.1 MAG: hypothetical protein UV00_C0005G0013 [candidate division WWE3 bacterium GW2011_GWF1_42_14]KKS40528.1 MAG: hypothetical protein UV03_C0005G0014 [candidate division WWE3 bacterium GW2011_GWE1_42_16]KKS66963.1 MAG: hypothetical protein UV35_C0005G0044 [candidate division WWE3 bacte